MRTKSKHPIDRAIANFLRALDRIESNASGMPWYEAARCKSLRQGIALTSAPPSYKSLGMLQIEEIESNPIN